METYETEYMYNGTRCQPCFLWIWKALFEITKFTVTANSNANQNVNYFSPAWKKTVCKKFPFYASAVGRFPFFDRFLPIDGSF